MLCAIAVLVGLLISLLPVITGLDKDSKTGNKEYLSQSRLSQVLWPFCFMFGFVRTLQLERLCLLNVGPLVQQIGHHLKQPSFHDPVATYYDKYDQRDSINTPCTPRSSLLLLRFLLLS